MLNNLVYLLDEKENPMKRRTWLWLSTSLTLVLLFTAIIIGPLYADINDTSTAKHSVVKPMIILEPKDGGV